MNEASTSEPIHPAIAWVEPPGMGKTIGIGVAVGVAASFLGVGGAFLAAGQGWGPALGMGAFVAMWGGLGFGGMVGGVVWATQVENAEALERREAADGTSAEVRPAPQGPRSTGHDSRPSVAGPVMSAVD